MKEYGVLRLDPEIRKPQRGYHGRFLPGHIPYNKGKTWAEIGTPASHENSKKGWANLDKMRFKPRDHYNSGRKRKHVVCLDDEGNDIHFDSISGAGEWLIRKGCGRENIRRCCRDNQSKLERYGRPGDINSDHRYKGYRWYFEDDLQWVHKRTISRRK